MLSGGATAVNGACHQPAEEEASSGTMAMHKETRRHRAIWLALLLIGTLSGCFYPIHVTDECKQQMNDCLADCPAAPPPRTEGMTSGGSLDHDARSSCEQRCHAICQRM